MGVEVTQIGVS